MDSSLWSAYSQHYSRLGSRPLNELPLPAHVTHQNNIPPSYGTAGNHLLLPQHLNSRSSTQTDASFTPHALMGSSYNPSLLRSSIQSTTKSPFSSYQGDSRYKTNDNEYSNSFIQHSLASNTTNSEGGTGNNGSSSLESSVWFNSSMASHAWRHPSMMNNSSRGAFGMLPHETIVSRGHIWDRRNEAIESQAKSNMALANSTCMEQGINSNNYRMVLPSSCPPNFVDQTSSSRPSNPPNSYFSSMNDAYYSYLKSGFQAYKSYSTNLELSAASNSNAPYCYSQSLYSAFDMSSAKRDAAPCSTPLNHQYASHNNVINCRDSSSPYHNADIHSHYGPTKQGYPSSLGVPQYFSNYSNTNSPSCSSSMDFHSYNNESLTPNGKMQAGNQTPGYPPMSTPIPASTPSQSSLQATMGQAYVPICSSNIQQECNPAATHFHQTPIHTPSTCGGTQPPTPSSPSKLELSQLSSPPSSSLDHSTYSLQSPKTALHSVPPIHEDPPLSNSSSLSSSDDSNPMLETAQISHENNQASILNFHESSNVPQEDSKLIMAYKYPYEETNSDMMINKPRSGINNMYHQSQERIFIPEDLSKETLNKDDCQYKELGKLKEKEEFTAKNEQFEVGQIYKSNSKEIKTEDFRGEVIEPVNTTISTNNDSNQKTKLPVASCTDSSNSSSWVNPSDQSLEKEEIPSGELSKSESAYCESEYSKSEDECCLDLSNKICPEIEGDDLDFLDELPSESVDEASQKLPNQEKKMKDPKGFLQSFFSFLDDANEPLISPSFSNSNKNSVSFSEEKNNSSGDLDKPPPSDAPNSLKTCPLKPSPKPMEPQEICNSNSIAPLQNKLSFSKASPTKLSAAAFSSDEDDDDSNQGFSNTVAMAIERLDEDCDGNNCYEKQLPPPPKKIKLEQPEAQDQNTLIWKSTNPGAKYQNILKTNDSDQALTHSLSKNLADKSPNVDQFASGNLSSIKPRVRLSKEAPSSNKNSSEEITNSSSNQLLEPQRKKKLKFIKRNCVEGSWILEGQFRTGDFVIAISDVNKKTPPIWRIEGKSLLHQFQPTTYHGKPAYVSTMQYTAWRSSARLKFVGITVRVLPGVHQKMIVEHLGLTEKKDKERENENVHKPVHAQRENFVAFLQSLIQQILDPETAKKNEYILSVDGIEEITLEKRKGLIGTWNSNLRQCVDKFPCVSVVVCKERRKAPCQACHKESGQHIVQFHGRLYNSHTLKHLHSPSIKDTRFPLCTLCVQTISVYSRLVHHKYQFYHKCHTKVNKVRCKIDIKDPQVILDQCLNDNDWVTQMFQELVDLWNASDKLR